MKNKSLITNICIALLSALVIGFLALPYVEGISGYNCFDFLPYLSEGVDFDVALVYIAPLFMLIASAITLIFSVLGLLGDLNVIKSEKLLKIARLVNMIAAIVLVVFTLLAFILIFVLGSTPAYGLIINLVLTIVVVVAAVLNFVWSRK